MPRERTMLNEIRALLPRWEAEAKRTAEIPWLDPSVADSLTGQIRECAYELGRIVASCPDCRPGDSGCGTCGDLGWKLPEEGK